MKKIYKKNNFEVVIDVWKRANNKGWSAVHSVPDLFLWLFVLWNGFYMDSQSVCRKFF